jgi:S-(hydroxymethyl)glutathione dehydrogenase/alcohol dehydrogenase
MKTKGAILREGARRWDIEELDLGEPQFGEILVKIVASGLCHSDDHAVTGDIPRRHYPFCGGHEGAGVVEAIGPGVSAVAPGDHIVTSFIPSCGRCRWCAAGVQNLCERGLSIMSGTQTDGTYRMHLGEEGVSGGTSTFCQYTVMSERSVVPIPSDIGLTVACLLGCAVPTGWGAAVNGANVQPGDVVIVMGVGGVGINAVQGARIAGARRIIAVDPVAFKLEQAALFGATDTASTMEEATELARSLTNGQGAAATVVTVGVVTGGHISQAIASISKGGTVALTGVGSVGLHDVKLDIFEVAMYQKRLQGVLYGMCSPNRDVPRLVELYRDGKLMLDELITKRYTLDQINDGYADMHAGRNIRGIIEMEHSA